MLPESAVRGKLATAWEDGHGSICRGSSDPHERTLPRSLPRVCCRYQLDVSPTCPWTPPLQRLVDLEYTSVEIMIHETDGHLKPSEVLADLDTAPCGSAGRRTG